MLGWNSVATVPAPGPYRLLSLEVSMITGDETEPSLEQRSVTGASEMWEKSRENAVQNQSGFYVKTHGYKM